MSVERTIRTVDQRLMLAPLDRVFQAARSVERWPEWLPHYRWVRRLPGNGTGADLVEMAAWRPFGPFNWPTSWTSEMWTDDATLTVHFRHVRGITRGMDVAWRLTTEQGGTLVTIVHEWTGPSWPLIGRAAAAWVVGPVFVHGIASRTLAGIARVVEHNDD